MAQMSHPIKHDSLPRVPLCAHIRFAQNSFFVLRTKSSASMALTKTKNKTKKTTTKKNNSKKQQQTNKKKHTKNRQDTTNLCSGATARAYKIYVTNVSVFLLFLFMVSSIWGQMVLKPYSGCCGFALIRLFLCRWFCSLCSFLWHMCSMVVLRKLENADCSLQYYFLTYKTGYTCVGYVT